MRLKVLVFSLLLIATIFAQNNIKEDTLKVEKSIKLVSPNKGEYWAVGTFPIILWESKNISQIKIELSIDNGASWKVISANTMAINGLFNKWQVPYSFVSDSCRIKISQFDSLGNFDESERTFSIVDSLTTKKIVVIGSSTAAGAGPTSTDSAWVNRYRNYIVGKNSATTVINLAVGGYTTYELMPDDFVPPLGKPSPSIGHNITKAISYQPKAIIINLPSNDVAKGFGIEEQIANYDTMLARATAANIPVWVTTTQPRDLNISQIELQMEMRDSTYTHFGDFAINFWTELALDNGTIDPRYGAGDGIHLNNAGHRILFNRVVDSKIYEQVFLPTFVEVTVVENAKRFELTQNYPNPFNPTTEISFSIAQEGNTTLKIYNTLGQELETLVNKKLTAGIYKYKFDASNLAAGTYFYKLESNNIFQVKKVMLIK